MYQITVFALKIKEEVHSLNDLARQNNHPHNCETYVVS